MKIRTEIVKGNKKAYIELENKWEIQAFKTYMMGDQSGSMVQAQLGLDLAHQFIKEVSRK